MLKRFKENHKSREKELKKLKIKLKKKLAETELEASDRDYLFRGSDVKSRREKVSHKLEMETEINEALNESEAILG